MLAKNARRTSTFRLISAAIKDRDIAARGKGNTEGIIDDEIMKMLQTMVKQRHESIIHFEQAGRIDMVDQEKEEITIIQELLPTQLNDNDIKGLVIDAVEELKAESIKDMGRVMKYLREKYVGQMDFKLASGFVKEILVT